LSIYRDFAKTHANPDTDGNSPNRLPLAVKMILSSFEKG
jgi:hypothetical protein